MKESNGSQPTRFKRKSLFDQTNFLGRIWFCYVFPIFLKGAKKNGLDVGDISQCPVDDEAEKLLAQLSTNWSSESKKRNPKLWWAILRSFTKQVIFPMCILLFIECFLNIVQPFLLGLVIQYFAGDERIDYQTACLCAGGICLTTIVSITLVHPTFVHMARVGMKIRIACCCLLYQKSLKLSRASLNETAASQIINIMGNDSMRFDEFAFFSTYLITGPIQTAIVIYFLWSYLGVSCFAGLLILVLFIPFQSLMGKFFSRIRLGTAILTDTRLRYMTEIISGIRVIKQYSWEEPFSNRVANARKAEVSNIRRACFLKALNLSFFFVVSRLILFASFIVYVLLGNILTSEAVFVTMSLLNTLRLTMTLFFPQAVGYGAELGITCRRIQNFLQLEEITTSWAVNGDSKGNGVSLIKEHATNEPSESKLSVKGISGSWTKNQSRKTLDNISLDLCPGDLLAVIGPVGSGKSSFLMSLLKELPLESGTIELKGKVCYSSQDSWNFNDSVRNNILFGTEYIDARFQEVVEVCALERDLKLMPFGDRTLVGEKGVSLSGGQKARINLARAVYRDGDIFLLDDPLSAVDTAVAEHIFERCIMEHLKAKIRVLVTHQIQFIEKATKILILKEGQCLAYGTYSELQKMGIDFMSLLETAENEQHADGTPVRSNSLSMSMGSSLSIPGGGRSTTSIRRDLLEASKIDQLNEEEEKLLKVEEEQFQRGSISGRTYLEYLKAGTGPIMLLSMLLFTIISQTIYNGLDIFITLWTNKNQQGPVEEDEQNWDIILYTILVVALFVSTILRSITFFAICMRASVRLHNKIFSRLLRAPVAFFDSNPAGRILNRFTKDLGIIDETLPYVAYDLNLIALQAIGIIVTVGFVNWYLIFPAIFLTTIVLFIRSIYIKSARDIKRYENMTRSPVYSHVSTTFTGLASIRAYGAQRTFEKQFNLYQNDHTATFFLFITSSRAVGLVIDWVCILFNIIIIVTVMVSKDLPGGNAGLAISSGLLLAGMSQWGVRQSCEFESQMTSVERIVEYQDLGQEAPAKSRKDRQPGDKWPASGEIEMANMSLAYNEESPVLKNLTVTIEGGEKIGIVGRTGAGKSSIIAALFRLTEPMGAIRIDGIDISSIGLDDLRRQISIIPQDPVIFSGTVRYNLDPFSEYPDHALWSALEKVQLKSTVDHFNGKLDAKLSDNGGNLSVGQRQLICLARAILRRNKILICDEATSNVDHVTDGLIQRTIRSEFSACTVLTIAHRLNTIIDCDRVLVLDAGEILEFDSPYNLLKTRGHFYKMCTKTGKAIFAHLYQQAKRAATSRKRTHSIGVPSTDVLPEIQEDSNNNGDDEAVLQFIDLEKS